MLPEFYGRLIPAPSMAKLGPDHPPAWQLNHPFVHYPGGQFAQFIAYHNDRRGLYLACEDPAGNVKLFRALHRAPGLRLGVAHIGDWPRRGRRMLEYDTVLGTFRGDWHAAAELYRDWSLKQKWAMPLHRRQDVPGWLLESPPYITIRPQGVVDAGPVFPVREFLPYEKCLPLLDRIARRVKAPLAVLFMGWERGASWVYPDCFQPVGGEASLKRFTAKARQRGWHVGSFCNGTRWVVSHSWNEYDGRGYYRKHRGEDGACRLPDGRPWMDDWGWRNSYLACMGAPQTRRIAGAFVRRLLGWGFDSIQFFDQNCGAATFPCFGRRHEHPPLPGKWMARTMAETVAGFRRAAAAAGATEAIQSVEMCCNETCLPLFQESDSRLMPPGHKPEWNRIPLYQYLYHECIVMQGHMGHAPEPYHLQIRNAYNGAMGEIHGGVLTGDGTLLDKDTENWAEWEPKVGSDREALEMIRSVTAMRRGAGRDFLLYGRMLRPAAVGGIPTVRWTCGGQEHAIPAVFHAAWQAPDGHFAVALANWTSRPRRVKVADRRLGRALVLHTCGRTADTRRVRMARGGLTFSVPPLGMALCAMCA